MSKLIPYLGGKRLLTKTILSLLPEHRLYCEPFGGSGTILLEKEPSGVEVINDIDGEIDALRVNLKAQLQAPVPIAFLPLQDCVDFAIFLIRTTIIMQHWIVGVRGVGGAIDVAVITQADGFKEIQKKKIVGEER